MPGHHSDPYDRTHRWEHHDFVLPVDPDLAPDDPGEPSSVHHPIPHVPRASQYRVLIAIAAGGFLGTLARYLLELLWVSAPGHFPWPTFVVNTSGSLLLGVLLTQIVEKGGSPRYLRPFACVGLLGSWTTMSTFALEADTLIRDGYLGVAVLYAVATLLAGLATAWVGITVTRAVVVPEKRNAT